MDTRYPLPEMIEITQLTREYYELVHEYAHYKDRDCHWSIQTQWSYGNHPVYVVYHAGYIYTEVEESYLSFQEAVIVLRNRLQQAIQEERDNPRSHR